MTNICTKVTVRKRPIKNGQVSLYLDNYLATLSPSRDLYQKDSLSKQKTRHVFTSTTLKIFH